MTSSIKNSAPIEAINDPRWFVAGIKRKDTRYTKILNNPAATGPIRKTTNNGSEKRVANPNPT